MRHRNALTIPITLRRQAVEPLHEQIAAQIRAAVRHGLLADRAPLPSTRTLAGLLGVSRGVAATAYELLFTAGLLEVHPGSGTYVCGGPGTGKRTAAPGAGPVSGSATIDLRPGQLATEAFPLPAWRAAWRQASFGPPPAQPLPPLGLPELRHAIAEHVRRTRGGWVSGTDVVVTAGTAHGVRLVLDALGLCGSQVAVAEPVPPALHRAIGGAPYPLPVDAGGIRVDPIPAGCRAVVAGPDALEPLGTIMSAPRRRALAGWAERTGGQLIEVACDTVFRPAASSLPRLPSIVVGGFCDLLTPALKLGYAVVTRELAGMLAGRIDDLAEQPPYLTQAAVTSLLRDGTVVRLMHRLGRRYAAQRRLVDAALGGLSGARLGGRDPVNTAVLYLPGPAESTVDGLLHRGVRVETLGPYHFSGPAPAGLVVGYGHLPDPVLRKGLVVLAGCLG